MFLKFKKGYIGWGSCGSLGASLKLSLYAHSLACNAVNPAPFVESLRLALTSEYPCWRLCNSSWLGPTVACHSGSFSISSLSDSWDSYSHPAIQPPTSLLALNRRERESKVLKKFSNFREARQVQVTLYCVKNVRFHKALSTILYPTQHHHTHTEAHSLSTAASGRLPRPMAAFSMSSVIDLCAQTCVERLLTI